MFAPPRYAGRSRLTYVPDLDKTSTGFLDIDYDADGWADWDENVHGPMDTKVHREEWPENFVWSCCGRPGDDDSGCEEVPHSLS